MIIKEEARRRNQGVGKEESWKRNLAGGTVEEESKRNHGGRIMEKNQEGEIMKEGARKRGKLSL